VELSAILLARVLSFFELVDVTPRSGIFFPDLVKELVQHCNFQKFPASLDEWNNPEGAQFLVGRLGKTVIDRFIVYNNGVQVETHAGTEESKRILEELLVWSRDKFGIAYQSASVRRWAYVSGVTFRSDVPLLVTGPIERLARGITTEISRVLGEETVYQPTGFNVGHDLLLRKYPRAAFTLQRRAEVPLSDNKYFSEAPLPTEVHLALLAQYEKDVDEMLNPRSLAAQS
jgi:hypothetical protein